MLNRPPNNCSQIQNGESWQRHARGGALWGDALNRDDMGWLDGPRPFDDPAAGGPSFQI